MKIDQQITFLYTRDLQKSARFYEDILGLSLTLDQGMCHIYYVTDNAYLGLCYRDDAADADFNRQHRSVIFTFVTQDVDEWYEQLRAKGVEFEKAPALTAEYQIYNCFLRDPNGYLLEIQRFLDPNWNGQT